MTVRALLSCCLLLAATTTASRRIAGGSDAAIADFPYQLALELRGAHHCGAVVVSHIYALTAAACVEGADAEDVGLRAGSAALGDGGFVHAALGLTPHPDFDYFTRDFNLAVVLSVPFLFGNEVAAAPLAPAGSSLAPGTAAVVSGWGADANGGPPSPTLRQAAVTVAEQDDCAAAYAALNITLTDNMLCAGAPGAGVCEGDTGGPLVAGGVLVGVTSFGTVCGDESYPGVFTDVAALRDWIDANTADRRP